MIELECKQCGNKFFVYPGEVKTSKYCSRKCFEVSERKTNNIIIKGDYAEIIIDSPKYGIKKIIIDTDDIKKVKLLSWHLKKNNKTNIFYVHSHNRFNNDKNTRVLLHRYLMNCPDNMQIDHINRNTLDNRRCNLRICTQLENARNKTIKLNRNVYYQKNKGIYQVSIRYLGKCISGGYYKSIEDARKKAEEMRNIYFPNLYKELVINEQAT